MAPPAAPSSTRPAERIRLVVIFGGQSAEHDISCITARNVLAAADPARYAVEPIGITRDGRWLRAHDAGDALATGPAELPTALVVAGPEVDPLPVMSAGDGESVVVLPLLHGPLGEDGTVQGLLELADVPYVGSGVLGSALAMDKAKAKEVLGFAGIPQTPWLSVHALGGLDPDALRHRVADELGWPVFVKPANMGSSVGISKVADPGDFTGAVALAERYDEWLVIETAVDRAREIEVAVLGDDPARASVPGEVVPAAEFYDFDDKYRDGTAQLRIPAPLPPEVTDEVRALALRAYHALRCEGLARVDFFYQDPGAGLLLNEINTMPGFTPVSMYPRLWEASGLPYRALIDELVALAVARHRRRSSLRSAPSA